MPGNEVGERIHNFFGQESLSQAQHQPQVVDGTWPGFDNSLWVDSQRRVGSPFNSNLKNYNGQQSVDLERRPSSSVQQGPNYPQSSLRPEFLRTQPHDLHHGTNGYVHGHQAFQAMQNEANVLGVDTEFDRHSLMSKGVPINYDFFGAQQQINGQFPAMLQSLPRQQAVINDTQLLQQQLMLRQMHELQRQQQLAQPEARQFSPANQGGVLGKQTNDTHSAGRINAGSFQETSNNAWQPELMTTNPNWLQCGISPPVQGSSSGLILSPEQGQMRMMGLVPQQFDQSLYGVPLSSTRVPTSFPHLQMDRSVMQHMSGNSNSFPPSQYAAFSNQGHMQHGALLSGERIMEKDMFSHAPGEGSSKGHHLENEQQVDAPEKNMFLHGFSARQERVGASEQLQEKPMESATPSHHVSALDPTEEKILFGSDDNLWEAFGNCSNMSSGHNMVGGPDTFGAFSSMHGTWSALMQSAVAETSSGETGIQEEWSGMNARNNGPPYGNLHPSTVHDGSNQHPAWVDNTRTVSTLNSRPFPPSDNTNQSGFVGQQSGVKNPFARSERLQTDASQTVVQQCLDGGSKQFDGSSLLKPVAESRETTGNISSQNISAYGSNVPPSSLPHGWKFVEPVSSGEGASLRELRHTHNCQSGEAKSAMHEGVDGGHGMWKTGLHSRAAILLGHEKPVVHSPQNVERGFDTKSAVAEKGSSTARDTRESSQQPSPSLNNFFLDEKNFRLNSGRNDSSGTHPFHLDKSTQILESSANKRMGKGSAESHEMENSAKENSHDSFRSNLSANISASGRRDNNLQIAGDTHALLGGKQKPVGHSNRRPSVTRKFQYHPMGDIDLDEEPSFARATQSQSMTQPASRGDGGYSGQATSPSHMAKNHMEVEKDQLRQGDLKRMDEVPHKSMHLGSMPGRSASFDRSAGSCDQNKNPSSSQNMLELLQKVDQSQENSSEPRFSISDISQSSGIPEAKSFDESAVHLQHNHSSASQGFSLQLGPPSQWVTTPDHASSSQSILSSIPLPSAALASKASIPSLPHHETSKGAFWKNIAGISGQNNGQTSQFNTQATGFLHGRSHLQSQNITGPDAQITTSEPANLPCDNFTSQLKQREESIERAQKSPSEALFPDISKNNFASSSEPSQTNLRVRNHTTEPDQGFPLLEAMPASQPSIPSAMSQQGRAPLQMPESPWANNSAQQHQLGTQTFKSPPDLFKSRLSQMQIMKSAANDLQPDGGDHPQISPQMAPSWFNQYGTLKNGQVVPMYDAQRSTSSKMTEQPLIVGKPFDSLHSHKVMEQKNDADPTQLGNVQQSLSVISKTSEPLLSPQSLPPDNNLAIRQKKRRTETIGLLSWSKEVMQSSHSLQSVSAAEVEWARAINRLAEKLEDEAELMEDVPSVLRSKRRLVLTTQLTQQLFRPPPADVLSSEATSNYETVAYISARTALGDTCSSLSSSKGNSAMPGDNPNHLSERPTACERIGDQYISRATEDFIGRAKKLENDLSCLERRTSVSDLRVECQDLEKFSVINRFAKFHGRGQADGAETSTSMDPSRNYQKFHPQRYVSALPMPKNIPDRVQCYSL